MGKALTAVILFLIFFISTKPAYAVRNINISSDKSSIFGEEEATITSIPSGFSEAETIYIKGAFFQEGTTNYFGYTKSGDTWIKNGTSTTSQKQVKIGEWDGKINVKSDFSDSGFKGEGEYKFKVGFYYSTSAGNLSSVNWSANTLSISISEPDPTPTPTPSPQPKSPTPTPTPSPQKTPSPSPKNSPQILGTQEASSAPSNSPNPQPSPTPQVKSQSKTKVAAILTGSGAIIIGASIGFFLLQKKVYRKKGETKDKPD